MVTVIVLARWMTKIKHNPRAIALVQIPIIVSMDIDYRA